MPLVDLSSDTLARLEEQLAADLKAVRRALALLTQRKEVAQEPPAALSLLPDPAPMKEPEAVILTEETAPPAPSAPVETTLAPVVRPPGIGAAVPQAVGLMTGEFGIEKVRRVLASERLGAYADTDIRRILNKMVKTGALRVVKVGVGRGGSTYERVTQG